MREIKLPFGRAADGVMVSIQSVVRGLACECTCPQCNAPLVACKGEVVRPYFRHYVDPSVCSYARETALHLFAKQLIVSDHHRLVLPPGLGNSSGARAEVTLPFGVRPDVLIEYQGGETLAVEILVAHQVDQEKTKLYAKHDQAAVEIDLSPYRFVDDPDWIAIAVLGQAERWWIYPPLTVRIENERQRQLEIDLLRREREAAIQAMEQAMGQRLFEERRLRALKDKEEIRKQTIEVEFALAAERARLDAAEDRQKQVKQAEEYNRTADLREAIRARRERERIPPSLATLVAAFGSYGAITPEAWTQWDTDMANYVQRVRSGAYYDPIIVGGALGGAKVSA